MHDLESVRSATHTKIFALGCLLVLFLVYQYGSKQAVASNSVIISYSAKESRVEGDAQLKGRKDHAGEHQHEQPESKQKENLQEHDSKPGSESDQNVRPKSNLMFVKTHKCGTSSLVNIFYLYGIRRRLNFSLKPYKHHLGLNMNILDGKLE